MGDQASLPQLWDLIKNHPDHFVRWGALRAVVAIDLEEGTQALAMAAVEDPHRHVREAAAAALQKVCATHEEQGIVRTSPRTEGTT
jgi:HEAT repeat protein